MSKYQGLPDIVYDQPDVFESDPAEYETDLQTRQHWIRARAFDVAGKEGNDGGHGGRQTNGTAAGSTAGDETNDVVEEPLIHMDQASERFGATVLVADEYTDFSDLAARKRKAYKAYRRMMTTSTPRDPSGGEVGLRDTADAAMLYEENVYEWYQRLAFETKQLSQVLSQKKDLKKEDDKAMKGSPMDVQQLEKNVHKLADSLANMTGISEDGAGTQESAPFPHHRLYQELQQQLDQFHQRASALDTQPEDPDASDRGTKTHPTDSVHYELHYTQQMSQEKTRSAQRQLQARLNRLEQRIYGIEGDHNAAVMDDSSAMIPKRSTTEGMASDVPLATLADRLDAQFRLISQPKTLDIFLKTIKFFMAANPDHAATPGDPGNKPSHADTSSIRMDKQIVEKVNYLYQIWQRLETLLPNALDILPDMVMQLQAAHHDLRDAQQHMRLLALILEQQEALRLRLLDLEQTFQAMQVTVKENADMVKSNTAWLKERIDHVLERVDMAP